MKLIKKLQECATIGQADPILTRLGAGPAVKKLVETAIILSNSQDPQQRSHAYSFMESAIKELEDDDEKLHEEVMGQHSGEDGLPTKPIGAEGNSPENKTMTEEEDKDDEHKVKEEVLDNHNNGPREDGSEQSTDNTAPYPGEGTDTTTGEKPMQDMDGTVNQWNETGGMPPGAGGPPGGGMPPGAAGGMPPGNPMQQAGGGMPPGMGGGMPGMMPGLAPDVAQEMGMVMPNLPPMDTNQMMRQMQYTVKNMVTDLYKKEIVPLRNRLQEQYRQSNSDKKQYNSILKQQREAIKSLSQEIQETKSHNGSMSLDIDALRKNSTAKFRETVPTFDDFSGFEGRNGSPTIQPVPQRQKMKLDIARAEIEQMDKILNSKSSIYN